MKRLLSTVLFLSVILSLSACEKKNPFTGNPEAIKAGAELYRTHCERCHGPQGSGGVCPNLTDKDWKYGGSDKDIFRSIASGRPGGMPAWKDIISRDDIWKVIAYIRTLEK
jgi:cytochrome c oxidase cbb3-type subunit 3